MNKKTAFIGALALVLLLSGCGIFKKNKTERIRIQENMTQAIGVNGYLWRSTLDSLVALPLLSTDPAGGVIMTDWFSDPTVPHERLKVTVFISDYRLRADALSVNVIRQELMGGVWVSATVQEGTEQKIEDTILTRARTLWIQNIDD